MTADSAYLRREMELRGEVEDAREVAETYETVMRWSVVGGTVGLVGFFGGIVVGVLGFLSTPQACAILFPCLGLALASLVFGLWWRDQHLKRRDSYGHIIQRLGTPRARLRAAQREYEQHSMGAGS